MLKIHGHEGSLLNLGTVELDDIDNSPIIVSAKQLFLYTTGFYPLMGEKEIINCSNLRFVGNLIYQSNTFEDAILNQELNPVDDIQLYDLTKDSAYLLVNLTKNVAAVSESFYQICRFCSDTEYLKINAFFTRQGQKESFNIHEDLLGLNYHANSMTKELIDFNYETDYLPSITAHAEIKINEHVSFGTIIEGDLESIGPFKVIYVQNVEDIPPNHINNFRHAIIDIKPDLITPLRLITNTVTTADLLQQLTEQYSAKGLETVNILSYTRAGLPIYIEYNFESDVIDTLLVGYSVEALEDYVLYVTRSILDVNKELDEIQIKEIKRTEGENLENHVQDHSPGGRTF